MKSQQLRKKEVIPTVKAEARHITGGPPTREALLSRRDYIWTADDS